MGRIASFSFHAKTILSCDRLGSLSRNKAKASSPDLAIAFLTYRLYGYLYRFGVPTLLRLRKVYVTVYIATRERKT